MWGLEETRGWRPTPLLSILARARTVAFRICMWLQFQFGSFPNADDKSINGSRWRGDVARHQMCLLLAGIGVDERQDNMCNIAGNGG